MGRNPQYLQLILVAVILAIGGIGWIIRKLAEQAARKQASANRERRELERLRTGRDPGLEEMMSGPDPSMEAQMAARREAQLQELRRRAAQRKGQSQPAVGPAAGTQGVMIQIPGMSGPILVKRIPTQGSRPGSPARPARQGPGGRPKRAAPRPAPSPAKMTPAQEPETSYRLLEESTPEATPEPVRAAFAQGNTSPKSGPDWRRALLMREILSPPLSIREQQEGETVY